MKNVSGIILAGGKSSRMGTNKALIKFGTNSLIENTVNLFKEIFKEVIIVSNEPELYQDLKIKVIKDIIPAGPVSGIHAGLVEAQNFYSFFTACDMPFLHKQLIEKIVEESQGYDVAVPKMGEYFEPLFAVYSKNCIQPIEEDLQNGICQIINFYPKVKVKHIDQEVINSIVNPNKVFFNVNTKEDLLKAKGMQDPP